jgi:alpha-tubulin suppressor-like RCC1 family protein
MTARSTWLLLLFGLAGCGDAVWPAPVDGTPAFSLAQIALRPGDSVVVQAALLSTEGDTVAATTTLLVRDTAVAILHDGRVHAREVGDTWLVGSFAGLLDSIPLRVGVRFVSFSVGQLHACALTDDGRAYCWGDNEHRGLPTGSLADATAPTRLPAAASFVAVVAADPLTTYMLDQCGLLWVGVADDFQDPRLPGPSGATVALTRVRAGDAACGLAPDGGLWCWGANTYGQLGTGSTSQQHVWPPVRAHDTLTFTDFDQGEHGGTCGVQPDGIALCWGHNDSYQLGREPISGALPTAAPISGDLRWRSVELGGFHGCGVTLDSLGYCWGSFGGGRGGNGDSASTHAMPQPVAGNHRWQSISAGSSHTCGLTTDGVAMCWGYQPSAGGPQVTVPTPVPTELRFTTVRAGADFACGLATDGRLWCWGKNAFHRFGNPAAPAQSDSPVLVARQLDD